MTYKQSTGELFDASGKRLCIRKGCSVEFAPINEKHVCCSSRCNSAVQMEKFRQSKPEEYRAKKRRWHQKNKERINAKLKARRVEDPVFAAACNSISQRSRFKKLYGITPEQKRQILASQDGRCANHGCSRVLTGILDQCVDHNHVTGKVRAILCRKCNLALGHCGDSAEVLRGLAEYLEAYDLQTVHG